MRDRASFALLAIVAALAFAPSASAQVSVGHSGWSWGNPVPQGNTLHAVEFSGGIGYAAGDFGTLLRTPDGGSTWQGIATGITGNLLRIRLKLDDVSYENARMFLFSAVLERFLAEFATINSFTELTTEN